MPRCLTYRRFNPINLLFLSIYRFEDFKVETKLIYFQSPGGIYLGFVSVFALILRPFYHMNKPERAPPQIIKII